MFNWKIFDYIFLSLKGYKKSYFTRDIVAGIVVAALTIPVSMGYAEISGLPAIYGLYASILPVLGYILLASSPQLSFGMTAAASAITSSTLVTLGLVANSPDAMKVIPVLALFSGIFLILFSIFRLGRFANYISMPVMSGFISGIAVSIIVGQIPKIMGIKPEGNNFFQNTASLFSQIEKTNLISLLMGVVAIAIILFFKKKFPKIPMSLIVLVIATVLSFLLDLEKFNVGIVGEIPKGLPSLHLPNIFSLPDFSSGIAGGFIIAVVCYADSLLSSNSFAIRNKYEINNNRELAAYGLSNILSAFCGCPPVGASVSRTAAGEQFRGKTQMVSIVAVGMIALVVAFLSGTLYYMPQPILSGIILAALVGVVEVDVIKALFRRSKKDAIIWTVSALGVLLVNVLFGVLLGVLLSFVDVIIRISAPPQACLGTLEGKNGYFDLSRNKKAKPIPHVVIYRFSGELFFANVKIFSKGIMESIKEDTKILIIDASGISHIDVTAADEIKNIIHELDKLDIQYYIANVIGRLREDIVNFGLATLVEEEHTQKTIRDALIASGMVEDIYIR